MIKQIIFLIVAGAFLSGCATFSSTSRSWEGVRSPASETLRQLDQSGKEIKVAILVSVGSSFSPEYFAERGYDINTWKQSIQAELISANESDINKSSFKNIKVVDRFRVNAILEEQKLQLSGAVSPNAVVHVGELSGATHIVYNEFLRTAAKQYGRFNDRITTRIIDVRNGEVISSQWINEVK